MSEVTVKAKRKPRAPKVTPETTAANAAAHDLIQAISWIDVAQHDDTLRPVYEQHCVISGGWIVAYDGVILAGHRITQEGTFAPNTAKLLAALVKSGDGLSMSHDSAKALLTVKSRKFRADVPCVDMTTLHIPAPETPMWEINDAVSAAFKIALQVTKQAPEVIVSSLLLTATGTVMGTDRRIFLEAHHGCGFHECVIPRHFARVVSSHEGLTHAGQSEDAVTLWYGPDKFLRCLTYERITWPPNPLELFNESKWAGVETPKDFIVAVEAVAPHSRDGNVHLTGDRVLSALTEAESAASHECAGIPAGIAFAGRDLAKALRLADKIEHVDGRGLFFFGPTHRGKVTAAALPGQHIGSDQPAAAHMAFDAPEGFVLPGVHDPIDPFGAEAQASTYRSVVNELAAQATMPPAPPWTPNGPVYAQGPGAFTIDDVPNPYEP